MEMKINLSYTKGKDGTCPISAELMTLSENHANIMVPKNWTTKIKK